MIDASCVHCLEQLLHAVGFLEEVHIVQVCIAIPVLPLLGRGEWGQQADGKRAKDSLDVQSSVLLTASE